MLFDKKLKAFIPTVDAEKAKDFYMHTLGLKLLSEDSYAMEFAAGGASLRVTIVNELNPHPFTVLGWAVDEITSVIKALHVKGVTFEKYNFFDQDELGIWTSPNGARVAWFKDPDGNLLSLTQHA